MTTPASTHSNPPSPWDRRLAVGAGTGGTGTGAGGEGSSGTRQSQEGERESAGTGAGGEGSSGTRQSQERRGLPHFDVPGLIQHITFHLADSLPRSAIERMQQEVETMPDSKRELARRQRIQELLDNGLGNCVLGEPACAQIVQDSLLFGDGERYHLFAWVIMPNHIHVLIEQLPGWPMAKVVQSWKRHTSRQIHRLLGLSSSTRPVGSSSSTRPDTEDKSAIPALWQRNYWDRYIRNDRHFQITKRYIEENPVKAGLAPFPEAWLWGSAYFESQTHTATNAKKSGQRQTSKDAGASSPTRN